VIERQRAAVVRGRVFDRAGNPLPGVSLSMLNHPELGATGTRADGRFDMAVNGGGPLTLDYRKAGYLPAQRQIEVPWHAYVQAPDVVMIPYDAPTTIDLDEATAYQVARGTVQTDADGTRQATILFPPGLGAEMLVGGTPVPLIGPLTVRATEYTVGPNGPDAMPAELPPASAYTYAVS
jgi:hypothetical protein